MSDRPAVRLTYLQRRSLAPRFSPDGTSIYFNAVGRGRSDVYRMNPDGSEIERLTFGEDHYWHTAFSPDGGRIACVVSHPVNDECHDIWTMKRDGSDPRRLTTTRRESSPAFSPDGEHIAFISGRDGLLEVYYMRADGSEQRRLTVTDDMPELRIGPHAANQTPVCDPTTGDIVFVSRQLGRSAHPDYPSRYTVQPAQIHRMRPDGSDRRPLIDMDGACDDTQFTPDGSSIAFRYWPRDSNGESHLCLVRPDGSGLLTVPGSQGLWESFHPSGDRVVFSSCRDRKSDQYGRNWDLYCVDVRDGALQRLTDNEAMDAYPVFSPDGSRIIFCSDRDGQMEIYVMDDPAPGPTRWTASA